VLVPVEYLFNLVRQHAHHSINHANQQTKLMASVALHFWQHAASVQHDDWMGGTRLQA
jgi:hypothetical protein